MEFFIIPQIEKFCVVKEQNILYRSSITHNTNTIIVHQEQDAARRTKQIKARCTKINQNKLFSIAFVILLVFKQAKKKQQQILDKKKKSIFFTN